MNRFVSGTNWYFTGDAPTEGVTNSCWANSIPVHIADGSRPKARAQKEMTFKRKMDRFKWENSNLDFSW